MKSFRTLAILWLGAAAPALAATVTIEKVVKTGDAVPGRPFASVQFRGRANQLPGTINDAGVVAFQATSEHTNSFFQNDPILGTRQGIYVWIPGSPSTLRVVADTTITSAGGPGTFAVPGHPNAKFDLMPAAPLLNNNGVVVFYARYNDPVLGAKLGLFSTTINGTTTSIVKIADTTDIVPGFAVPFSAFTSSSTGFVNLTLASLNDSGQVAFYATFDGSTKQGIFGASVSGGSIVRLADSAGTVVPAGQAQAINFVDLPVAMNNAGNVVFHARLTSSLRGVFSAPVTGGPVATVALQGQTAPSTTQSFGSPFTGSDVNSSGTVAFNNQLQPLSPFEQGNYFGNITGGPRSVVADTLGGFPVPGRPGTSMLDRLSFAGINDSQELGFFARIVSVGITNDQGIYLANGAGGSITRVVDRGIVPPGLSAPAALTAFDPTIESGSFTVAGGGSAAINDLGNLVLTGTGATSTGGSLRGIYFYDRCTPELVRIVDSTISPSAPPTGLGGTFSGGVQALFGFQNSEARSGYYRTINENNDVTFLGRFDSINYGIYVAHITTSGGGQLQIACPPDMVAECPANTDPTATGTATASGCGTITVSHSDSASAGCGAAYSISRTWTASNGSTSASCVQTISVVDTSNPVLSGVPGDAAVQCDALPPTPSVTASDVCEGPVAVTVSETQAAGACPGTYVLTRTWTATDGCSNSVSVSQDVAVMDTVDPLLIGVPGDVSVECDAVPPPATVTASDTCDTNIPVTFVESQVNGSCADEYVLARSWSATDDCGNDVTAQQFVSVDDTTPPSINCPPHTSMECPGDTSVAANGSAGGSDNCGLTTIASSDSVVTGCGTTQTITRTWTASDECDNLSSCDQYVTVADTTAPVITLDTAPVTVTDSDCSGSEPAALPSGSAADACDGAVALVNDAPATFPIGATTVTYSASDACGNTATTSLQVDILGGATIDVQADRHTVGSGSFPGSTKTPLVGILACAYNKAQGSCAMTVCGGVSHQQYQCIIDQCTPDGCDETDSTGEALIHVQPGNYIVVSGDSTKTTLPDPLGVSVGEVQCGQVHKKYLQQIVRADGSKKPAKYTVLTGSMLLIIEPEYIVWDNTVQLYPFVFETIGDWVVTASVAPPEGFVADHEALTADVDNELESVQFVITEVGSDLIPTETKFDIVHKGERKTVRSNIGILLTPDYARSRGFDVDKLKQKGLIVDPIDRTGTKNRSNRAGAK